MTLKDLLPTKIRELFFPSKTQTATSTSEGTVGDTYNATQIDSMSFPTLNIATEVRSPSFDSQIRTINSNFTFQQFGAISIGTVKGTGTALTGTGVRISPYGIYGYNAGVAKFSINAITGDATFAGILSAPTGSIGGWSINPTNLTNNDATLSSAGQLSLGTSNDIAILSSVDGTYRLWIGNASAGSAAFYVKKNGEMKATSAYISGDIVLDNNGDQGTGTKLRWNGGSRIWSDSSNRIGINSIGQGMRIYTNSIERFYISDTNVNITTNTLYTNNINLALSGSEGSIYNVDIIKGADDVRFQCGYSAGQLFKFLDYNGNETAWINSSTGYIESASDTIKLGGFTLRLTANRVW